MAKDKRSYGDLLKDPRWQRKRLEILQRDDFTCKTCYATDKTLHVHHKGYVFGKKPWEYEDDVLVTLCLDCHEDATKWTALLRSSLSRVEPGFLEGIRGYVDGLVANHTGSKIEVDLSNLSTYLYGLAHFYRCDEYEFYQELLKRHPGGGTVTLSPSDLFGIFKLLHPRWDK